MPASLILTGLSSSGGPFPRGCLGARVDVIREVLPEVDEDAYLEREAREEAEAAAATSTSATTSSGSESGVTSPGPDSAPNDLTKAPESLKNDTFTPARGLSEAKTVETDQKVMNGCTDSDEASTNYDCNLFCEKGALHFPGNLHQLFIIVFNIFSIWAPIPFFEGASDLTASEKRNLLEI
ncbi:unnamed protein product [Protopolystoma xenopodis]|uniref:Uncharacterized protein n=1 Tax=Protopolystoma xenopodis TaxID=117903 RepID=A0A448WK89_9PLAT|nr:unnamed protein product [Protopolystoma xenopodis]